VLLLLLSSTEPTLDSTLVIGFSFFNRHLEVTESLDQHVREKLQVALEKFKGTVLHQKLCERENQSSAVQYFGYLPLQLVPIYVQCKIICVFKNGCCNAQWPLELM
jgi:hypothetical protein